MTSASRLLWMIEGLSKILYHRTTLHNLLGILKSNSFKLTTTNHGTADALLNLNSKKGAKKDYYLSTMRSPSGTYGGDTTIVLDGEKLSQRYEGKPVDYWGKGYRDANKGQYEQEDRIYSSKHIMPNALSYMLAVHVYVSDLNAWRKTALRECWKICKQNGIKFYFYDNRKAYNLLDTRRALGLKQVDLKLADKDIEQQKVPVKPDLNRHDYDKIYAPLDRARNVFDRWLELYFKKSSKELSKQAYDRLYSSFRDKVDSLGADVHNHKNSDEVQKLLKILKKHGWDIPKFVEFLDAKWNKIRKVEEYQEALQQREHMIQNVEQRLQAGDDLQSILKEIHNRYGYDTEIHGNQLVAKRSWGELSKLGPLRWDIPDSILAAASQI